MTEGEMQFLLPHERWLAGWILGSQRKRRTPAVVGMEQKYGPQGMVWMDAYLANILSGAIPVLASFILVIADPGQTSRITLYLLAVVFLFLVLGVIRFLQASRAGRRFRRERH